jgi:hypothetical protein
VFSGYQWPGAAALYVMADRMLRILTLLAALGMGVSCDTAPKHVPPAFRGEFSFNRPATLAYWDAQSDWPLEVKERLAKMAIPTTLRIEAGRVVITDVASGQSMTQQVGILRASSDTMVLELHSNFAQTNTATTFQFDAGGFWLCEGTLFPNYRERFERVKKP